MSSCGDAAGFPALKIMDPSIIILIGEDPRPKAKRLAALKERWLPSDDALKLDYERLDAYKLSCRALRECLLVLPAVAARRLVVVTNCQHLTKPVKDALAAYAGAPWDHLVLVLEAARMTATDPWIKKFQKKAEIVGSSPGPGQNVFDMTRAMATRKPEEALRILFELLSGGDQPLQIMGALVWFWCHKIKDRLNGVLYAEGLQCLQQADLNIKRSRLRPDYALELVVVKLTGLLARG